MNELIGEFYRENRLLLLKRLHHRAGSPEDAEDVLHEAFTRALKYKDSFDPERHEIGAWFNTIMNNTLMKFKREDRLGGMTIEYDEGYSESYEMSQTDGDMAKRIQDRIAERDGHTKDVLHLFFEKEYKINEIREVLDLPYKTIQAIVYRFKGDMIEEFGDD